MAAVSRLIALVLLLCAPLAHALVPSSYQYRTNSLPLGPWVATTAAACAYYQSTSGRTVTGVIGAHPNWQCAVAGWESVGILIQSACPANSTPSGGQCACNTGYVENSGSTACVVQPTEQELLCTALGGTETYASGPGNIAPGASSCNASGCMTTFANTLIRVKNAQGQYVTEGAATFTGGTCTYSETTGTAEDTCPGGASGQVNGVTVCVPYDGTENTIETVGGSESSTTEGGETTSTSTGSTTMCSNGSCTTTTNITTTVNGGTPTTKTTTTSEPQDEFCKRNPTATQCKENGSFTGNCNSSFVCKGDAIQCATAKAANESLCKFKDMLEMDTATRALVDSVLAGTWEKNPRDEPRTESLGSFDQSNPLSGACPGDIAISIATVSVVIPLGSFCPQLQMMGNLLVAFTLLSATVFVFRGTA